MYGNPNARVSCTYREFMEELMTILPSLKFISQNELPLNEISTEAAMTAFVKKIDAPLLREVLITQKRYGMILFKS